MFSPHQFRPHNEWAVLCAEQRRKVVGGIFLTDSLTGVERVSEGAARVIAVGTSDKFKAVELTKGARVLFRGFVKYAHPLESDERWDDGEKKHYFLIKFDDICCELDEQVDIGCFSGL
jgi:co-chaperonin GroES (HSP10)